MSERLSTTIKHFQDGVKKMGVTAARHSIEAWKSDLEGFDEPIFHTIATDLGHLHDELGKDEIDGAKVGKLMAKLGKETVESAKSAGDKSADVTALGELLEKAAGELGGGKSSADETKAAPHEGDEAGEKGKDGRELHGAAKAAHDKKAST